MRQGLRLNSGISIFYKTVFRLIFEKFKILSEAFFILFCYFLYLFVPREHVKTDERYSFACVDCSSLIINSFVDGLYLFIQYADGVVLSADEVSSFHFGVENKSFVYDSFAELFFLFWKVPTEHMFEKSE